MTRSELHRLTAPGVRRHRMRLAAEQASRPLTRREWLRHLGACVLMLGVWFLFMWMAMSAGEYRGGLSGLESPPVETR